MFPINAHVLNKQGLVMGSEYVLNSEVHLTLEFMVIFRKPVDKNKAVNCFCGYVLWKRLTEL